MIRQDFKEGKTVRVLGLCAGKFVVEGLNNGV